MKSLALRKIMFALFLSLLCSLLSGETAKFPAFKEVISNMELYLLSHSTDWETADYLAAIKKNPGTIVPEGPVRRTYYWLGNDIFRQDLKKAISYYKVAFLYCRSNLDRTISTQWLLALPSDIYSGIEDRELSIPLDEWEHEGYSNAPCYFIAYNIACALSLLEEFEEAALWLKISLYMNPELLKMTEEDADLDNFRQDAPGFYEEILWKVISDWELSRTIWARSALRNP